MDENAIERSNVKACFGLDGGELRGPGEAFGAHRYWYDGTPEWCTGRDGHFTSEQGDSGRYRTIVTVVIGDTVDASDIPEGWRYVAHYRSCSEVTCNACSGTDEHDEADTCPYCEGGGVQWLGDEWCEIVVERPEWDCAYDAKWLGSVDARDVTGRGPGWAERADLYRIDHASGVVWSACWGDAVGQECLIPDVLVTQAVLVAWPWLAVARERFAVTTRD